MEGFIKIPNAILQDQDLNHTQMILYGYILSLSTNKGYCYASNQALGEYLHITKSRVSNHLASLKEKGYIEISEGQLRQIIPLAKNSKGVANIGKGVAKNSKGGCQKQQPYIDKEIDKENKEINKEFETFRKLFPHARKGKKQDAKKFYLQVNNPSSVNQEVRHLKLKIMAGLQNPQYVPACERWIRDFTPLSDEVKVQELEKIMKWHLTTEGAKERYPELVEVYGETRVKAMAKKLSPTLDFNKPKDVQI